MDPSQNNSFGTPPIISSGSGDIVLPSAPKKSKKPLVITLIIILLAALLGFGAWWYFDGSQFNPQSDLPDIPTAVAEPLNRYGNYLLYGTEATTFIDMAETDDDVDKQYKISTILDAPTAEQEAYFMRLSSLYDIFLTAVKDNNINIDTDALASFAAVLANYRSEPTTKNYYMILRSYREIKEELIREK